MNLHCFQLIDFSCKMVTDIVLPNKITVILLQKRFFNFMQMCIHTLIQTYYSGRHTDTRTHTQLNKRHKDTHTSM